MAKNKWNPESIATQSRIKWMKDHPDKQEHTCKHCKKTTLVYDPEYPEDGFPVNNNIYKGVSKGSLANDCYSCRQLKRLGQKCVISKRIEKVNNEKLSDKEIEEIDKNKVKASWICQRCDLINSGKRKVCRSCNSVKYRSSGVTQNKLKVFKSMQKWGS